MTIPNPLPVGTLYDGKSIAGLVTSDPADDYQPHCYLLSDGSTVWIPIDEHDELESTP